MAERAFKLNSNFRGIIPQAFRNYDSEDNRQREASRSFLVDINAKDNFELIFAFLTDQNEPASTKHGILSWLQYKFYELELPQADRIFWYLIENLNQADADTISLSIELFGNLHDNRAVPIITEFLGGDFELTAIIALRKIGHPDSKEPLYQLMRKYPPGHVRRKVLASNLAESFRDRRVINELIFNLRRDDFYVDVGEESREIRILGTFGDPVAIPSLLKLSLDYFADIREAAIDALADLVNFLDKSLTPTCLSQLEKESALKVKVALLTLIAKQGFYDVTEITLDLLDQLQTETYIDSTATSPENDDPWDILDAKRQLIAILPYLDKMKALRLLENFLTREKQADEQGLVEMSVRHSLLCVMSDEYLIAIPKDMFRNFVNFVLGKQKMTVTELLEITSPVVFEFFHTLPADNSNVQINKYLDINYCYQIVYKFGGKKEAEALQVILDIKAKNGTLGLLPRIRLTSLINWLSLK